MTELSAADKNELRRQKILAKRKTRMAYAAGDRTTLPSTAAADPASPRVPASASSVSASTAAAGSTDTQPPSALASATSAPPPLPRFPSLSQLAAAGAPARAPSRTGRLSANAAQLASAPRLRLTLCLLFGVLFALSAASEPPLSAVEAFCVLQAVLFVPMLPHWLQRRRYSVAPSGPSFLEPGGGGGGGGGLLGIVDFVTRASTVFVVVNRAFGELCVYLTAFLFTADMAGRWA